MANIFITNKCNLNCEYCFANKYTNINESEITISNFKTVLDFLTINDSQCRIGIIGGEPTLHSQFEEIINVVKENKKIKTAVIFTNGINLDKHLKILKDKKIKVLINCNYKDDIGESRYNQLLNNIDLIMKKNEYNVLFGLNLYKQNQNTDFIIDLLEKYNQKCVRISLSVDCEKKYENIIHHQRTLFPKLQQLLIRLEKINVKPLFDCNKVLPCIDKSFYNANQMHCLPIIDIFPNFDAIRCFGFSDIYKTNITKHKNIDDVIRYFIENIDNKVYKIRTANECFNCEYFSEYYCGCLSYKKDQIINVRE